MTTLRLRGYEGDLQSNQNLLNLEMKFPSVLVGVFLFSSSNSQPKNHPSTAPKIKRMENPQVFSTSIPSTFSSCIGTHVLISCKTFGILAVENSSESLKKNKRCYRCPDHCHLAANCYRSEKCGKDGCKSAHHPLTYPKGTAKMIGNMILKHLSTKGP